MLIKLLKYDLKYMIKNMFIFYILAIFFASLTRILFSMEQSFMIKLIGQISVGCMFSMTASILINVLMRSWVRFRDSIYKDESYLTHTLPVTKNDIYNSKFIQALLFFIISFIVVLLSLFITYYTKERWLLLTDYVKKITTGLEFNTIVFVGSMLTVTFLEIFNAIQCGFLGIILGHKRNNGKLGFSILFGFIAYLVVQNLVLLLIFIIGLFDTSIMALFQNNTIMNTNSLKLLIILSIIIYIFMIGIMNMVCKKELNKGINIE